MVDSLKHSNSEISMASNIVTLDNLNELGENFFKKATHKGKLFKGPNWTAYNKENLGSIPRTVEKALVEDKKSMTKIGFNTQTERFYPKIDSAKQCPGPGTYNLSGDMDFTRTSTSFYNSKGFGNGFVSQSERFNDSSLYYSKYAPGPGEYQPQKNCSISEEVNKKLVHKSLYNNKKTRSLKVKRNTPGPGQYNPIMDTFDLKWKINKYKGQDAVFKSIVPRFKKKKGLEPPGPGKYFKDEYYIDYNDKNKPKTMSYFFMNPSKKKTDPLKKFDIKTKQEKEDARFKLITQKGNRIINSAAAIGITAKDIYKIRNKGFLYGKSRDKEPTLYEEQLIMANGGLANDTGMEYIHRIIHRPEKPDIFQLYAPRWRKNELALKVPGPAYYHPKIQPKMLSFNNADKNHFIVTPGAINPKADNPIEDII
jgi:hypothetical protein